jgi:hypothetical protein
MIYEKSASAQLDKIEKNVVIMNTQTMECFILNDSAAAIWDAMDYYRDEDQLLVMLEEAGVKDAAVVFDQLTAVLIQGGLLRRLEA